MSHSNIVGGSTARRVMACPGSVKLVAAAPPEIQLEAADEGRMLHSVIRLVIERGLGAINPGMLYGDREITPDNFEKIVQAYEAFKEWLKLGPEYRLEERVGFGEYLPGVYGTADIVGRVGNMGYVIDWKFGRVNVSAEDNDQLLFYAAAALRTPGVREMFVGVDQFMLGIIQPPAVEWWEVSLRDIGAFEHRLKDAVELVATENPPLFVGTHCNYCRAKTACPILTGAAQQALVSSLQNVSPDRMAQYLEWVPRLTKWADAVQDQAMVMMQEGITIPGYKLVAKRGTRRWIDEAQARLDLEKAGFKDEHLLALRSVAQVEKHGRIPPGLVEQRSSGVTVAPLKDKREEVLGMSNLAASIKLLGDT